MNLRKNRLYRLLLWILTIFIAILSTSIYQYFFAPKTAIVVDCPSDMLSAFKSALKQTTDPKKFKIVIDNSKPDLIVGYAKESDNAYKQIAFSPFVIGYTSDNNLEKKLEKLNTLIESKFSTEYYDLDFSKVFDAIINNADLVELGFNNDLVIICPSESSIYWHDFYNFMLITGNNGVYPNSQEEKTVKEKISKFFSSSHIRMTNNFENQIINTDGFSNKVLYIIPEQTLENLSYVKGYSCKVLYPLNTVNFYYYVKNCSSNGNKIFSATNSKDFVHYLHFNYYRSNEDPSIFSYRYCDGIRNLYNAVEIPAD